MPDSLHILRQVVESIQPLSEEEWLAFSGIWEPFTAKRKEIITAAGEKERNLYFVVSGVQRVFYYDEKGREATLVFTYHPSFGGVLDSMLLDKISVYNYETLTASVFLKASYAGLKELMEARPVIQTMILSGITQALSGILERLVEIQCFSSEEKFRKLMDRSPHILQFVPHKYLANYLGIDSTNFSKLLNQVKS